jgi:hypothetical protein
VGSGSQRHGWHRLKEEELFMATTIRIVIGLLLIAHGLVHLLYLSSRVPEFNLENSWLVPESRTRPVGNVLIAATVAAFAFLGLAVWGVPGLVGAWSGIAIAGSVLSLVLLVAFWNWSLIFGVLVDLALIAVALLRPEWTERIGG